MMEKQGYVVFFLANVVCFSSSISFSATPVVNVFGPQEGVQQTAKKGQKTNYVLHLASFKDHNNTLSYLKRLKSKVHAPIHVTHTATPNSVDHVFIGPLTSLNALHHISQTLLSSHPITTKTPPAAALIAQPLPTQKLASTTVATNESPRGPRIPAFAGNSMEPKMITTAVTAQKPQFISLNHVISVNFGPGWGSNGRSQTVFIEQDLYKTYTAAHSNRNLVQGEIAFDWKKNIRNELYGQAGIALGTSSNASLTGNVWEDGSPEFNNFKYNYKLTHSYIALHGTLLTEKWHQFSPYISASLGLAVNQSHDFSLNPYISNEVPAPLFQSHSTTAFTYTVGTGIKTSINPHWQTGIGYAFSDWGRSQLAPAVGEALNNAPSLSHFYINSLVFNISYLTS